MYASSIIDVNIMFWTEITKLEGDIYWPMDHAFVEK